MQVNSPLVLKGWPRVLSDPVLVIRSEGLVVGVGFFPPFYLFVCFFGVGFFSPPSVQIEAVNISVFCF